MLCMMLFVPAAGALSDKLGRKPMWWASLGGLFLLVIPLYQLMATGLWGAIVGFAVLGLLYVPQLATISATFPAMFPTPVRFAGLAIAYNVSTSLFGVGSALIAFLIMLLYFQFQALASGLYDSVELLYVVPVAVFAWTLDRKSVV